MNTTVSEWESLDNDMYGTWLGKYRVLVYDAGGSGNRLRVDVFVPRGNECPEGRILVQSQPLDTNDAKLAIVRATVIARCAIAEENA